LVSQTGEKRLEVFENGVQKKIFGSKWQRVGGKCLKSYEERINHFYSLPKRIRGPKS
jgi:hypothetical protein